MIEKLKRIFNKYFSTPKPTPIVKRDDCISFHVAGISFHDDEVNKLIKVLLKDGAIEKYDGMTNSEIKEYGDSVSIYENQYIGGVKLEGYEYKGKDAIRVLVKDTQDQYYDVGNVPEEYIERVSDLLTDETIEFTNAEYEIVGGKTKYIEYDDDDKPELVEDELNYGICILIYYKKKD